ncbi:hypothetical protein MFIFM68171_03157 [Madurella fahalii]|uniref:Uncharacterized protein n=1 Tax=Madurella fahalii TaxID=1157608 RepID=A0ABQ0G5C6_9PEZI
MHEPDDEPLGSGGSWDGLSLSPSISSLSSFSPEDDYHHSSFHTQPTQQTAPEPPSQSHSPRVSISFPPPSLIPRPKSQSPSKLRSATKPSPSSSPRRNLAQSQIQTARTQNYHHHNRPSPGITTNNSSSSNSNSSNSNNNNHLRGPSPASTIPRSFASPTPTNLSGVGLGLHQHMGMVGGLTTPVTPLQHHQQAWYLHHRQVSVGRPSPGRHNRVGFADEERREEEGEEGEEGEEEATGGYDGKGLVEEHVDHVGHDHEDADDEDEGEGEGEGEGEVEGEAEAEIGLGTGDEGGMMNGDGDVDNEGRIRGWEERRDDDEDDDYDYDHARDARDYEGRDYEGRDYEAGEQHGPASYAHPDDVPSDDRVELMERLCDLVQRLSMGRVGGGMETDVIDVLHAKVDEMEEILLMAEDVTRAEAEAEAEAEAGAEAEAEAETEANPQPEEDQSRSKFESRPGSDTGRQNKEERPMSRAESGQSSPPRVTEQDVFGRVTPPHWLMSMGHSELSISPTRSHPELAAATNEALEAAKEAALAQAEAAERVAIEAEALSSKLEKVVKNLLARKEESDHLHSILLERAEAAAFRILDLEKEVTDLEDDILSNESELRHLRLKIRAVETLCYEFVPPDADPELFQSIENWKADWVLIRDRMLERKKDRKERRLRLHRAGSLIDANAQEDNGDGESTLTSLGGLSMSVSLLGIPSKNPRKR